MKFLRGNEIRHRDSFSIAAVYIIILEYQKFIGEENIELKIHLYRSARFNLDRRIKRSKKAIVGKEGPRSQSGT